MVYNKPNIEDLQNYLQNDSSNSSSNSRDIKWWSLPVGTSIIRVLPPWDATGRVALEVYQHRIEYTEPGSRFTKYNWTCVGRTFGRPCNICNGLKEMRDAGINTENWEAGSRQFYINALVVQDPGYGRSPDALNPGTHVLMRIPKTVYDWIVTQITNPTIGDITDPVSGIDIMITRAGSGLNTTYSCTMTPNGRRSINSNILDSLELYNLSEIFSTGFDDARVNGLVSSLRNSATHLAGSIPGVQQQMNANPGYQAQYQQPTSQQVPQYQLPIQAPVQQPVPQVPQFNPVNPGQFNVPASPFQSAPAQQPVQQPVVKPAQPFIQPAPTQANNPPVSVQQPVQPPLEAQMPKCFGQYNSADVNCITCPHEIACLGGK